MTDIMQWSGFRPAAAVDAVADGSASDASRDLFGVGKAVHVTFVDWSIEVVLSTSTMLQPAANGVPLVNLTLTLSDGRAVQRRLTAAELHQWRYSLARATKDLHVIASRQPPPESAAGAAKSKGKPAK